VFLGAGALKIADGVSEQAPIYASLGMAEIVLVGFLWSTRWKRPAALAMGMIALVGTIYVLRWRSLDGSVRRCNCLGDLIEFDYEQHLVFNGVIMIGCALVLAIGRSGGRQRVPRCWSSIAYREPDD